MVRVKTLVLDILKPHQPYALEFCQVLASVGEDYNVNLTGIEMDEETATTEVVIEEKKRFMDPVTDFVTGSFYASL
jgi:hypothetical protein